MWFTVNWRNRWCLVQFDSNLVAGTAVGGTGDRIPRLRCRYRPTGELERPGCNGQGEGRTTIVAPTLATFRITQTDTTADARRGRSGTARSAGAGHRAPQ
jgi:hypothetical protein